MVENLSEVGLVYVQRHVCLTKKDVENFVIKNKLHNLAPLVNC